MRNFERALRYEPNRQSRELQQPRYVQPRADKQYSADDDGDERTLVTGRRGTRLLASRPGHSQVDFARRPRSPAHLPRTVRDVVDILNRSESEYDDRRRQAAHADGRRSARSSRVVIKVLRVF